MLIAVRNALRLPDLRKKIFITLGILAVYRLAATIPVPGVNGQVLQGIFENNALLGFMNIMSGGALENFSVIAMGVYPYITAQIIIQLLIPIIPALTALSKEGEQGRQKINQYTLWLTIPMATLQAFGQSTLLKSQGALPNFGFTKQMRSPTFVIIVSLVAGTMFAMWLGQIITEQGIGNGISIIIFGGIVAESTAQYRPADLVTAVSDAGGVHSDHHRDRRCDRLHPGRPATDPGAVRQAGASHARQPAEGGRWTEHLHSAACQLRRHDPADLCPKLAAVSRHDRLLLPALTGLRGPDRHVLHDDFDAIEHVYWILYFFLVVAFTYFYTDVIFREQNLAELLQRQGGFIPGIRPGKRTEDYLNAVMSRITIAGALFLAGIAVLPWLISLVNPTGRCVKHPVADLQRRPADRGRCGVGYDEAARSPAADAALRRVHPIGAKAPG